MNIKKLMELTNSLCLTQKPNLEMRISGGIGADLMSDVLSSAQPGAVLISGLCNPQIIRTAEMADIPVVLFIRGKKPSQETISLAEQSAIILLSTDLGMFESCGLLFSDGLTSCELPFDPEEC